MPHQGEDGAPYTFHSKCLPPREEVMLMSDNTKTQQEKIRLTTLVKSAG